MIENNIYKVPIVTHEDFVLSIQRLDIQGNLIDYSGWTAEFIGRENPNTEEVIFNYSEKDQVKLEEFDLNGQPQNIKATIPWQKTEEMRGKFSRIHIGLLLTPPEGSNDSPQQVIVNDEILIVKAIVS